MKIHPYKLNLDNCIILENVRRIKHGLEKIKDLKDLARMIVANRNNNSDSKKINTIYVNLYRCQSKGFSNLNVKEDLIFDILCILKVSKEDLVINNPEV